MATAASETRITTAPALAAEHPVVWPPRTVRKLSNGMTVVLVEAHTIPKFKIGRAHV